MLHEILWLLTGLLATCGDNNIQIVLLIQKECKCPLGVVLEYAKKTLICLDKCFLFVLDIIMLPLKKVGQIAFHILVGLYVCQDVSLQQLTGERLGQ